MKKQLQIINFHVQLNKEFLNLFILKEYLVYKTQAVMNKQYTDYTNFDSSKTNTRISQAPGGSSSFSLAWGDSAQQPVRKVNDRQRPQQNYQYTNQPNYNNNGYQNGYVQKNNNRNMPQSQQNYGRKNTYSGSQQQVGGQYGYNNYNPITHGENSIKTNYQSSSQSYGNQYAQQNRYNPVMEQEPYYKPTNYSNKNFSQDQLDMALEEQKYKVESSRGQRSNQAKNSSNSLYQNNTNDTKPCVKIHQQRNNDIFGNDYDYWKQDGHQQNQKNVPKQKPYMYERNNGQGYNRGGSDYPYQNNARNEKTSVKVHNPPGGRTNFTLG